MAVRLLCPQWLCTVFRYAEETFIASGTPAADTGLTLEMSAEYTEKRYEYLDRKLRERPCCIQHTEEDFQVIIADLQLGQGFVCTLSNGEEITALAITYPIGKANWRIGEIVSDTPRYKNFTASTYLPKPESPVHPGSHSSRYR